MTKGNVAEAKKLIALPGSHQRV
ncbi:hypothetical protein THIOKS11100006 [Thiocapsa sp. KS1]|nr:hypothetical protein THIOKS11100006 [Thiocapsa sp. KS1]